MHGIGFYLGVHESLGTPTYLPGMFQSDEPGYYEPGNFGIRLETDIEVVEAKTIVYLFLYTLLSHVF